TLPTMSTYLASSPRGANEYPERWAAVRLLQQVTNPDQFVVSDDLAIPFEAGRLVIPQLADPSSGSSGCDLVSDAMFMEYTNHSGAAVIFWTDRLFKQQFFSRWVPTAFAGREPIEAERVIYYNQQKPQITYSLQLKFDHVIALEGYRVEGEAPLRLTLYWRKLQADAHDYKMTLRVVDEQGQVVDQMDRPPFEGFYPTNAWPVGVLLPEIIELSGSAAWLSDPYTLLFGLYRPQTLELLTVENNSRSDNLVLLSILPHY
ncbi:MAG: hypothetical protein HYR94_23625, partial [Chloroflexi bacterium]|nr:hypothetical protein [Chloroflexota bacterium]